MTPAPAQSRPGATSDRSANGAPPRLPLTPAPGRRRRLPRRLRGPPRPAPRGPCARRRTQALAASLLLGAGLLLLAGFYRFAVEHPAGVRRRVWPGAAAAIGTWLVVSWAFGAVRRLDCRLRALLRQPRGRRRAPRVALPHEPRARLRRRGQRRARARRVEAVSAVLRSRRDGDRPRALLRGPPRRRGVRRGDARPRAGRLHRGRRVRPLASIHAAYGEARSQVRVAHNEAFATGAERARRRRRHRPAFRPWPEAEPCRRA